MSQTIGHYQIISELGRGGMGVVYKAHEQSLNRYVAIKMLGDQVVNDPNLRARFLREARSAAALNHPNIIQIYYVGEDQGRPFFAMEYVSGVSLAQVIRTERQMAPKRAASILIQAASGLARAHDQGIIHRDIKPGNIMIDPHGLVKLADFGIAHVTEAGEKLTATGQFLGTPGYLSPEVCLGKPIEKRSDIFSLGIVYYEMLTGQTPFRSESPLAMLREVVELQVPDPRALNASVDLDSQLILLKMVAKSPEERYRDCHELVADLKRYLGAQALDTSSRPAGMANLAPNSPALSAAQDQPTVRIEPTSISDQPTELITPLGNQGPTLPHAETALGAAPARQADRVPPVPPRAGPDASTANTLDQPQANALPKQPAPPVRGKKSSPALALVALALFLGGGALGAWYFLGRDKQTGIEPESVPVAEDGATSTDSAEPESAELDPAEPDRYGDELEAELRDQQAAVTNAFSGAEPGGQDKADRNRQPAQTSGQANAFSSGSPSKASNKQVQSEPVKLTSNLNPDRSGAPLAPVAPIPLGTSTKTETRKTAAVSDPKLGLAVTGDPLFARPLQGYLVSLLQEQGFRVLDEDDLVLDTSRTNIRDLGDQVARGGGDILVFVQVTFLDQRELRYLNTSSTSYKADVSLKCWSPGRREKLGDDVRLTVEYTSLNAERNAEKAALKAIDTLVANVKR